MNAAVRAALGIAAAANAVVAIGFAVQAGWAVDAWPWVQSDLSHVFIGSIIAAIAAAAAWMAVSGERGSIPAGALNLAVTLGGIGFYMLVASGGDEPVDLRTYAGIALAIAVGNAVLFVGTLRRPGDGEKLAPPLVRWSFATFTAVLVAVGGALVLGVDGVMPWMLDADASVVFGWIFLGDAVYFLYGVLRPSWVNMRAQLWSFLAYDVVLFGPLLASLDGAAPALRDNIIVYLAVLTYSGALAVFYLLVHPRTRVVAASPHPS